MKRALITFCTFVFVLAVLTPLLPLEGEAQIYDEAIRLHVLANSDSDEDQALKLAVRDAVLEDVSLILENCNTRYEAEQAVRSSEDIIKESAQKIIKDNGYNYKVNITFANEYYPTKEYEGVSMPAGTYLSLKVMIGQAEGQNWWCVLYPPLCTGSASPEDTLSEAGFTPSQIRILTEGESPKYKLKFKFLEILESLFS